MEYPLGDCFLYLVAAAHRLYRGRVRTDKKLRMYAINLCGFTQHASAPERFDVIVKCTRIQVTMLSLMLVVSRHTHAV